jgi:putative transposase
MVGVDLGVQRLAMLSDGTEAPNPRHVQRRLKQIKRLHRMVSRRKQGSKNRKKAVRTLAKRYRTGAHPRADTLHQLTTRLTKTKSVSVSEDLNVAGMLTNQHLAQAIADVGFAEFTRQLLYKAAWYGSRVILADRWKPSSKTCGGCGWVDEQVTLADRTFHCQNPWVACGLVLDRDGNAAINLSKLAGSSSDRQNACGGGSAGRGREAPVQLASMKQEPNTFYPHAG